MLIIAKEPAANGAYPPIQTWPGITPPNTHYQIKDGLNLSLFTQYNGFVYILWCIWSPTMQPMRHGRKPCRPSLRPNRPPWNF